MPSENANISASGSPMLSGDTGSQRSSMDAPLSGVPAGSAANSESARIDTLAPPNLGERVYSIPTLIEYTSPSAAPSTASIDDFVRSPATSRRASMMPGTTSRQNFPSAVVNPFRRTMPANVTHVLNPGTPLTQNPLNGAHEVRIDVPREPDEVVQSRSWKEREKEGTHVPSVTHKLRCFNKKPMDKHEKRHQLKKFMKRELHPGRFNIIAYCCPDESVHTRALPSELREARAEVIQERRYSRLKKAFKVRKARKVKKMEVKLLDYRAHVQERVDKLNNKRASGVAVSQAEINKEIKKLRFIDAQMQRINQYAKKYAKYSKDTGLSLRRRIWNFLRGKEEYPPSTVKWKDLAREQRDDVKSFILDVGYALSLYNVPAYRLEYSLQLLAAYYGIDIELQSTPTQLLISFHDQAVDVEGNVEQPDLPMTRTFSSDSLADLENHVDNLSALADENGGSEIADSLIDAHLDLKSPADPKEHTNTDKNADMPESVRRFHTTHGDSLNRDIENMPSVRTHAHVDSEDIELDALDEGNNDRPFDAEWVDTYPPEITVSSPLVQPRVALSPVQIPPHSQPSVSGSAVVSDPGVATTVPNPRSPLTAQLSEPSPVTPNPIDARITERQQMNPSESSMFRHNPIRADSATMTQHDALFRKESAALLAKRSSDIDFLMHNSTHFIKVPSQSTDLTKLVQLEDLTENIHRGKLSIKDARKRVKQIIETQPSNGWYILPIVSTILTSMAFSVLLNANWKEMTAVFASAIFIVILEFLQHKIAAISTVFVTMAALIAGLVAVGFKYLYLSVDEDGPPLNIFLVSLAATVGFFPGLSITVSVNELAEQRYMAGLIRLTASALQVLKIGFGLLLANALAILIFPDNLAPPTDYTNPWWSYLIAVFFAVISYCISFRVPVYPLAIFFIYVGAYSAFSASVYVSRWIGTEFGTLLGAFAVGFCGDVYSRLTTHPSLVVISPAILLIVPGSLGVRAILQFSQRDIVGAVEFLFQIFIVAIALVVGLAFGRVFLPKRKRLNV